jgi:hypothetical protein
LLLIVCNPYWYEEAFTLLLLDKYGVSIMNQDTIDYGKLVDEAMHIIVYKVLKLVEQRGLPGDHHFFISFYTKHPGVKISEALLNKYPREMTIVLQYQYQSLEVSNDKMSVILSFDSVKEKITIPFSAITTFADPSVQFGLQFREVEYDYDDVDIEFDDEESPPAEGKSSSEKGAKSKKEPAAPKKAGKKGGKSKQENNVVSLDQFRKK